MIYVYSDELIAFCSYTVNRAAVQVGDRITRCFPHAGTASDRLSLKGPYPARNRGKSETYEAMYNISGVECCRAEISIVANATEAAPAVHLVDHLFEACISNE